MLGQYGNEIEEGRRDYTPMWSELLQKAISEPGLLLKAYSNFHHYSLGNQLAALIQCQMRNVEIGPINTYIGWRELGRQVKKGEKALWLCMPMVRKAAKGEADEETITGFCWKPRWFVLAQTEGDQVPEISIPAWDKDAAFKALGITKEGFNHHDGNVQGYAIKNRVAVSPIAELPHKTLFHELAHVVLGHTSEADFHDTPVTPRNLREVEAEAVALLLCETLGLAGAEYCRGYIQRWLKGDVIPESSARKIFGAADRILKAGGESRDRKDAAC